MPLKIRRRATARAIARAALALAFTCFFTACGNADKDTLAPASPPSGTAAATADNNASEALAPPAQDIAHLVKSPLSGAYITPEAARQRPVAVVINNHHKALPQSGISQADILYEVLAEGDITRIVAIFQGFDAAKIGPVRSARAYFLDFAIDNHAIFTHHGGSPQAYADIPRLKLDNLDGMQLDGSVFWRDPVRVKQPGMYEHSSYTNAENLEAEIAQKGYVNELGDSDKPMFQFYDEPSSPPDSQPALELTVPYSNSQHARFVYNDVEKTYTRYQGPKGDEPHIDAETNETLTCDNIIVQEANMYVIAGDNAGRREVNLVGDGKGYLFTNGVYAPITWKKTSRSAQTQWFDAKGEPLTLNQGKTWICVFIDLNQLQIIK